MRKSLALSGSLLTATAVVALLVVVVLRGGVTNDAPAEPTSNRSGSPSSPVAPVTTPLEQEEQLRDAGEEASERVELPGGAELARSVEPAGEVWRLKVRAQDATGAAIDTRDGSVTFALRGPGGSRWLTGRIVDGFWSASAPFPRAQLESASVYTARVADQRFSLHRRVKSREVRFEGAEEIVIEPVRPTHLQVIDPRTGALAKSARLVFSSVSDKSRNGTFTFELPFRGEPIRLDDLRIRELENQDLIEVLASIPAVGQESTRLELDGGTTYELRPSGAGSARLVCHRPDGYRLRNPRISIRPEQPINMRLHVASSRYRTIQLDDKTTSHTSESHESLASAPLTAVAEGLLEGRYVAELNANAEYRGSHLLGSASFSISAGKPTDVEFRLSPVEADPWRLLRVEVVLPPEFETKAVDGRLKQLGKHPTELALPRTKSHDRFLPVLVNSGQHEFRLQAPLDFALSFDVRTCPEHVERIILPEVVEYGVRFRHAVSREWVTVDQFYWRARLDSTELAQWKTASRGPRADAPVSIKACLPIEVQPSTSSQYTTREFIPAQLTRYDDGVVWVHTRPRVVVRFSSSEGVEPHEISSPVVRPLGAGRWPTGTSQRGFVKDTGGVFVAHLEGDGGFEIEFRPTEGYATPTNRIGHARLDEDTVIDVELVKTNRSDSPRTLPPESGLSGDPVEDSD